MEPEDEQEQNVNEMDDGGTEQAVSNRKNNTLRKAVGDIFNNIKDAAKDNAKSIFILKKKALMYGIIVAVAVVLLIIFVEGDAEETSAQLSRVTESIFESSTSKAAEEYKSTGSLIYATDDELEKVKEAYFEEIKDSRESFYEAFKIEFNGKESSSVANKVTHITSNFESNETQEVDRVTEETNNPSNATTPKEKRTIFEHILRTEKYNFNNIVWRSFVKGELKQDDIVYTVDEETRLKYPSVDSSADNSSDLTLEFYITKVRPYLQSWHIPFDLMVGTIDAQESANLNANFAYEILTSAYHEIVMDRYKMEKKSRINNYLVYDKTATAVTTTRTCADYKITGTTISRFKGDKCTASDSDSKCDDRVKYYYKKCTDLDFINGVEECGQHSDIGVTTFKALCTDSDFKTGAHGCNYGTLNEDITSKSSTTKTLCVDKTEEHKQKAEKDVRESIDSKDTYGYSWNYVISMAKMFDKVISNEYDFESYSNYTIDNYNSYIKKTGDYASMTVEEFLESEKNNSAAESIESESEDYNDKVTKTTVDNENWNSDYVTSIIPNSAVKISGTEQVKVVKEVVDETRVGKKYRDVYAWSDTLKFKESKSGIYNVDSVKDVTGNDLTSADYSYYNGLYNEKDINIIDLMNSDKDIYKNYVEYADRETTTNNIGIRKSALDISYNVLQKDLQELAESYPFSGLMYGNSLDILEGLNLSSIVSAGSVNEALTLAAEAHLGYDLDTMLTLNTYGTFFRNHWCAMYVSYCMRLVENETGTKIPIPNYTGCTSFWKENHNKPGFFDVKEWVDVHQGSQCVNNDPTHIAPLSSIQPGDIILYCWTNAGDRDHTAIVKSVEKDDSGKVTAITTIDGNWGGSGVGEPSYNYSKVRYAEHTRNGSSSYTNLSSIASFVSVSTVLAEAQNGNIW